MNSSLILTVIVFVLLFLLLFSGKRKEGYIWPCTNFNNWSNNLRPYAANCAATPWSVAVPAWEGQLDQGNGRIGDDSLSGYAYYNAY